MSIYDRNLSTPDINLQYSLCKGQSVWEWDPNNHIFYLKSRFYIYYLEFTISIWEWDPNRH